MYCSLDFCANNVQHQRFKKKKKVINTATRHLEFFLKIGIWITFLKFKVLWFAISFFQNVEFLQIMFRRKISLGFRECIPGKFSIY